MEQLSSLIELGTSPVGLTLGTLVFLGLVLWRRNELVHWLFLALVIFSASLSHFTDQWVPVPVPLFGPIDMMIKSGRWLTVILLSLLIVLPASYRRAPMSLPNFAFAFLLASMLISLKIFAGGSIFFASLSALTTLLIFGLFARIHQQWIQKDNDIDAGIAAIAAATLIFVAINSLQYILDAGPVTVPQGRFHGTTGNPQHAAAFLGVGIPALVYVVLTKSPPFKIVASLAAIVATFFLLSTGSRTGLIMVGVATVLLLRRSGFIAIGSVAIAAAMGFYVMISRGSESLQLERLGSLENTRAAVWSAMWRQFNENPIFGVPLSSDRLGFGESSWLAMAATVGLVGLLPLAIGAVMLSVTAWKLFIRRAPGRSARLQADFVVGTIASLLIGSIFEAYLLAVASSATFLLLLIGTLGTRRLSLNARITAERRRYRSQLSELRASGERMAMNWRNQ